MCFKCLNLVKKIYEFNINIMKLYEKYETYENFV